MGLRPADLPILERRDEIEAALRAAQVVVIAGATGSGKTTQLPQICLEMGLAGGKLIGHTQPRRLAARSVAARIAEERGVPLGGVVGVKVRFQDTTSRQTRIKLLTDGLLLAELAGDPLLLDYGVIIIDEAHERSLNVDVLLGYLRSLLPRRPDLKLIVTSATIDTARFSEHFGGPSRAPIIEVSGRLYPVEVRYRPQEPDEAGSADAAGVVDAARELLGPRGSPGDVLVFLPGEREIRACATALEREGLNAEILPLYARLTSQEQDRIFSPGARRRIILATNVAETSVTVPRIGGVIDSGLARVARYDPKRKIETLPIEPISQASADQRAGRCGRVAAGVCIRLFSEASMGARVRFTDPEIRRTDLAAVILRLKSLGFGDLSEFAFIDPPDAHAIADGYETLFELGAIDRPNAGAAITSMGRAMSRVPLDVRPARMLIAAEREGSLAETIPLAAALSVQDPRERPFGRQQEADRAHAIFEDATSDFLSLLKVWDQARHAEATMSRGEYFAWTRSVFLSPSRLREWADIAEQIEAVVDDLGMEVNTAPASSEAIHRAVLTGLISNVAAREIEGASSQAEYRTVRGQTASIFPGSVLAGKGPKWIVAAELVQTSRLFARTVARVDPAWVEELAGHMFSREIKDPHLDQESGEPSAWERVTMGRIVVVPRRRTALTHINPSLSREILCEQGLARGAYAEDHPVLRDNSRTLAMVGAAEGRLRRRGVGRDMKEIAHRLHSVLSESVVSRTTLVSWLTSSPDHAERLRLRPEDVLTAEALAACDPKRFPDTMVVRGPLGEVPCAVTYSLAPGKESDGVTVDVPLSALPGLSAERAAWLVPGMLGEVVLTLVKNLPKTSRQILEAQGDSLPELAEALAGVLEFGSGSLPAALTEAADVLWSAKIPESAWSLRALPPFLRLRVRVMSNEGEVLGEGRDIVELAARLAPRVQRALSEARRVAFDRRGLTTWDFESVPAEAVTADDRVWYPALEDEGASVALTLCASAEEAERMTHAGVRRFFAMACAEEVVLSLQSLAQWSEMVRWFSGLGSESELKHHAVTVIAERAFMEGQAPIRTREAFEARREGCWGRLTLVTREVGEVLARMLEPRARVAQRLSGGTPRLWVASVNDLREQAAYLMPTGFVSMVSWDRLRQYPKYTTLMRERLLSLREEGSKVESAALAEFLPRWKKFTAYVARRMSEERAAAERAGESAKADAARAPLPQARRAAARINLDAGAWAMSPGNLHPTMERYRWALEEWRLSLFAPEAAAVKPAWTAPQIDALLAQAEREMSVNRSGS